MRNYDEWFADVLNPAIVDEGEKEPVSMSVEEFFGDSEIIDMRGKDFIEYLKECGVQIVSSRTDEENENNKCDAQKISDIVNLKMNDVAEMWSELNYVYNFEPYFGDPDEAKKVSFLNKHTYARSILKRPPNYLVGFEEADVLVKTKAIKDSLESRSVAYDFVMYGIEPSEDAALDGIAKKINFSKIELKSEPIMLPEPITFWSGSNDFLDECQRARIIKRAYEYVMSVGSMDDKIKAQHMYDVYSSIFSADKSIVLDYTPYEPEPVQASRACAAAQNSFKPKSLVYITIDASMAEEKNGTNGVFYSVTLPKNFSIDGKNLSKARYTFSTDSVDFMEKKEDTFVLGYHYSRLLKFTKTTGKDETGKWLREDTFINVKTFKQEFENFMKQKSQQKSQETKGR